MSFLHAGKILKIDLTKNTISTEPTARYTEKFIGGLGIEMKLVYDHLDPAAKALEPENVIVFSAAPFTGTIVPGTGRCHFTTKSATTGLLGGAAFGGMWAPELKYAGYDHILIQGRADKPVYLYIENDQVEIRDAAEVWGQDIYQAQSTIQKLHNDPELQVLCIGQAGENLVRYATVATGLADTGGRNGAGAVLGSKNLKAIAVRGTGGVRFADPDKYLELAKELHDLLRADPFITDAQENGTSDGIDDFPRSGMAAVHNFQSSAIPGQDVVLHRSYYDRYGVARICCFGCPVGCKDNYSVPGKGNGGSKCVNYHALTSLVSNVDLDLWWEATLLCQKQGIDISQIAGILAWLMELYQRGLIGTEQTDGIAMEWGSRSAILDIIKKIIAREGIGDVLAEDYHTIAAKMGPGTEEYFVHIKGNAIEVIDLRTTKSCALGGAIGSNQHYLASCTAFEQLGYSFYNAPGRFTAAEREEYWKFAHEEALKLTGTEKAADLDIDNYEGKAKLTYYTDGETVASNIMGFCKWHGAQMFGPHLTDKAAAIYAAGMGIEFTQEQLLDAASRVRCLEKAFEIMEGATRADDTISKRFFEPIKDGPFKGAYIDPVKLEEMKSEYYELRGWDPETGVPTRKTLEQLGLGSVADDLDRYFQAPGRAHHGLSHD